MEDQNVFGLSSISDLFLADSRFSRISGRSPFLTELFTNWSPVGVLMKSSGERLKTHNSFRCQLIMFILDINIFESFTC